MLTTASKITLARILLVPVYMILMLNGLVIPALVVFIVASITDFLDGYVARHYNQVSDFGKFVDPLADKFLVIAAMLIFLKWGRMPAWAVMVVLAREFAVSGLRMMAATNGTVIAAGMSGKVKTASTMVGLCVMMVLTPLYPAAACRWVDLIIMLVIVVTTAYSGVEYFYRNRAAIGF